MKILYIITGALNILSCNNSTHNKAAEDIKMPSDSISSPNPGYASDSGKWADNFLELRNALSRGDRKIVKSFINFPIKNKGNEIWYLADPELTMEIEPDEIKPFTEADFEKYFSSIFTLDLRKTIEKLNVEDFLKTNKSTSPEIEVVKGSTSKLEAKFDNSKNKITLALVTDLKEQANSKFTVLYLFDVLSNGNIKFVGVHVE